MRLPTKSPAWCARAACATGTATVFIQHTSASLVIYENADPSARTDLHAFFERLVPGGRKLLYPHRRGCATTPRRTCAWC